MTDAASLRGIHLPVDAPARGCGRAGVFRTLPPRMTMARLWIVAAGLSGMIPPATGHPSPADVIATLGERIAANGASARLLTARAYEHQSLGNWDAAIADFNAALELDPRFVAAISGGAEAQLRQGAWGEAREIARRGLDLSESPQSQAPFHALLARIAGGEECWQEAMESWRLALRSPQPEVDWFLGEAGVLAEMGRFGEQAGALARAMDRNPSVVLKRAWIHALVDAGDLKTASLEIEKGLAQSRWRGTWLLLRARVHALREEHAGRRADAAAALAEIQRRIHPDRPDPQLLDEAAMARRLLGGVIISHSN